jgi:hypothetical protein
VAIQPTWDVDVPLGEVAREFERLANNPDLHKVFFKVDGKVLPAEKTLRELKIDPARQEIEIVKLYWHPAFVDYSSLL